MDNNPVSKKVNTPKVNTWVNTFFTFGIWFLLEPYSSCSQLS